MASVANQFPRMFWFQRRKSHIPGYPLVPMISPLQNEGRGSGDGQGHVVGCTETHNQECLSRSNPQ